MPQKTPARTSEQSRELVANAIRKHNAKSVEDVVVHVDGLSLGRIYTLAGEAWIFFDPKSK